MRRGTVDEPLAGGAWQRYKEYVRWHRESHGVWGIALFPAASFEHDRRADRGGVVAGTVTPMQPTRACCSSAWMVWKARSGVAARANIVVVVGGEVTGERRHTMFPLHAAPLLSPSPVAILNQP